MRPLLSFRNRQSQGHAIPAFPAEDWQERHSTLCLNVFQSICLSVMPKSLPVKKNNIYFHIWLQRLADKCSWSYWSYQNNMRELFLEANLQGVCGTVSEGNGSGVWQVWKCASSFLKCGLRLYSWEMFTPNRRQIYKFTDLLETVRLVWVCEI